MALPRPRRSYVVPVAGDTRGFTEATPGDLLSARFDNPQGMCMSADQRYLYVLESYPTRVREIDLEARTTQTLFSGGLPTDNTIFRNTHYIALGPVSGDFYITKGRVGSTNSSANGTIFRVTPSGSWTAIWSSGWYSAVGIDCDPAEEWLYWTGASGGIFSLPHVFARIRVDGSDGQVFLEEQNFAGAGQVMGDWANDLVYGCRGRYFAHLVSRYNIATEVADRVLEGSFDQFQSTAVAIWDQWFFLARHFLHYYPNPPPVGYTTQYAPIGDGTSFKLTTMLTRMERASPDAPLLPWIYAVDSPTDTYEGINQFTDEGNSYDLDPASVAKHRIIKFRFPLIPPPLRGGQRGDDLWGSARAGQIDTLQRSVRGDESSGSYW